MDGPRFDSLARTFAATGSRRLVTRLLAGLALGGALSPPLLPEAEAGKKKRKKKAGKKAKKPRCVQQCGAGCSTCYDRPTGAVRCGGIASADCGLPCSTDADCPAARPVCTTGFTDRATGQRSTWGCPRACTNVAPCEHCEDGIQNGGEADVDCGGPECPRCAVGRTCRTRDDCATAHCVNNVCRACTTNPECGSDARGVCNCGDRDAPGVCWSSRATAAEATCAECPVGTAVCTDATEEFVGCHPYCAA
jgi:hypothetical protein